MLSLLAANLLLLAIVNKSTRLQTGRTEAAAEAVAPVVRTSSTRRTFLFFNSSSSRLNLLFRDMTGEGLWDLSAIESLARFGDESEIIRAVVAVGMERCLPSFLTKRDTGLYPLSCEFAVLEGTGRIMSHELVNFSLDSRNCADNFATQEIKENFPLYLIAEISCST